MRPYIFVKHRTDGKYEVRVAAQSSRDYKQMIMSLRIYVPESMRTFKHLPRTWVIENQCRNEVGLWVVKMTEALDPTVEFFCERDGAWEATVGESYRTLHVLPSAPWEVVRNAYEGLVEIYHVRGGGDREQLERLHAAYDKLRNELRKGDSGEDHH